VRSLKVVLAALVLLLAVASPAAAAPIGGLLIFPGASLDAASMHVHTAAGCPAKADAFYATAKGHGFADAGQIVISNTSAGLSHNHGFDGYLGETLADFAKDNQATLQGPYVITLYCVDSFTLTSYGEFTGTLQFGDAHRYAAVGAAMPTATPSPEPPDGDPTPLLGDAGPGFAAQTTTGPSVAAVHSTSLGGESTSWTLVVILTLVVLGLGAALVYRPRRLAVAASGSDEVAAPVAGAGRGAGAKKTGASSAGGSRGGASSASGAAPGPKKAAASSAGGAAAGPKKAGTSTTGASASGLKKAGESTTGASASGSAKTAAARTSGDPDETSHAQAGTRGRSVISAKKTTAPVPRPVKKASTVDKKP
jgi:hypothetical protein